LRASVIALCALVIALQLFGWRGFSSRTVDALRSSDRTQHAHSKSQHAR
jgi:hypothetical protein